MTITNTVDGVTYTLLIQERGDDTFSWKIAANDADGRESKRDERDTDIPFETAADAEMAGREAMDALVKGDL
ncbi:hypothetical protein RBI13_17915 [Alcaligenaceae bacterium A4P071]|uniref:hypothetical protein n=1 Tax=Schauerella aestuarii TaxID=2511204 RepID=UPI00136AABAD|nr:hypothetical protein [Achromobacter aestuarii]MDQ2139741.1 hypothetical protein [Alcaligenaceae bacterium B3P038]MDQ2150267.1 hypothetical protein [Alcaligenaceae bacterium C4P045]MDQ2187065.1 hypothetical protein [Alcaligenaceae bacterium A4P071]MYZ43197.1 hypothetical protein [Achromobacter aestuarii]